MTQADEIPQKPSMPPSGERRGHVFTAAARGLALFIGLFTIFNLMLGLRHLGYDANVWWIDLGPLQRRFPLLAEMALLFVALLWLGYALFPVLSDWRRRTVRTAMELLMLFVGWNILNYYAGLARGYYKTAFPVSFSIFVGVALVFLWIAVGNERQRRGPVAWGVMGVSAFACAVLFPLLQMVCFGLTDYRRPADVLVVFGARVYPDGHPSDALRDRVQTAIDFYLNERGQNRPVPTLIFSGGVAEGGLFSETDAMRRLALDAGVRDADILTDPLGVNTDASVHNVEPKLARMSEEHPERPLRVLAISHFYHLPRIKMRFKLDDQEVFTVPVRQPLNGTPKYMLREVAALWKYYLEALFTL